MRTFQETSESLDSIREAVDADIIDLDIDQQKNKMLKLTQLIGLSAECKSNAKRLLHLKEVEELQKIDKSFSPTLINATLKANCYEELALLEYADRLNSAVIHTIDSIRTVISLYKTELENSLKS